MHNEQFTFLSCLASATASIIDCYVKATGNVFCIICHLICRLFVLNAIAFFILEFKFDILGFCASFKMIQIKEHITLCATKKEQDTIQRTTSKVYVDSC
jgi:hypothetical protein